MNIYTDGSNTYNGKPHSFGGYAYIIEFDGYEIEGGNSMPVNEDDPVTNNKAELLAIIDALDFVCTEKLFLSDEINIYSDSQWCVKCGNLEWKRLKNHELWNRFNKLVHQLAMKRIKVKLNWVRGHNGHVMNERCDVLAKHYASLVKTSK